MRKPIVGIIGLTAQLYKEKFPEFVRELEKKYRNFIEKSFNFVEIADFSLVYKKSMVESAYKRIVDLNVDGIIIVFFSYAPSMIVAPVMKGNKIPVLIWNTQYLFEIGRKFSVSDMMNNHGMHGVQDLACVLLRQGTPFSIITGHHKQSDTLSSLAGWCRCAAIFNDLKKLRLGRIGEVFCDMGDFSVPDKLVYDVLGAKVIDIKMSEFRKESQNIPENELKKAMEEEEKKFRIEVNTQTRMICSRMELAFKKTYNKIWTSGDSNKFHGI